MKYLLVTVLLFTILTKSHAAYHLASSINEAINLLNKARPQDSIALKDGMYRDALVQFTGKGNAKDQVTFLAQTSGKVFFEGNSRLSTAGQYITITGFTWRNGGDSIGAKSVVELKTDHAVFTDCAIIKYNSLNTIDNKWVSVYGQYNTVSRCLFNDKNNLGATLTVWLTPGVEAHHTISYNYFLGRQNGPASDNGLESIRVGDSKTSFENAHCVVALNRFEACDGEIEIISNKSCHNSYLHNTFVNSDGGLTLRHGNNCLVDGNVFDGGSKPKSYGVRFIGEGHVAINNYFCNLHGSKAETFRSPVTLVTGLVNTPINGYFQVRRAVVADNIFVNCGLPDIRIGATPKRDGATLAPDTVVVKDNLFFDDKGSDGDVYEEVLQPSHLSVEGNKVVGKNLRSSKKGFSKVNAVGAKQNDPYRLVFNSGSDLIVMLGKSPMPQGNTAGSNMIEHSIAEKIKGSKYTFVSVKEVGPLWMR